MTKDDILNHVCHGGYLGKPTYLMTPDMQLLKLCKELEQDKLLIQVSKLNPSALNGEYSYVSNDTNGIEIANTMFI